MELLQGANEKADRFSCIIATVFWALVVIFAIVACAMTIPVLRYYVMGPTFLITMGAALFLLGMALIWLTLKARVTGALKKFLILTGASAAGFPVSVLLHNAFYGLGIVAEHITVLRYLMEVLHIAFFILAIFVCPLGFLTGAVGSVALFIQKGKRSRFS